MDVFGWLGIVFTAVMSVGAFVIAYFNNATRLMKRVDELTTRVFNLQDEAAKCRLEAAECQKREADLKAEVERCTARIRALETFTGTVSGPSSVSGIIVADLKGIIKEYSPAVTPILHYLPREMVGKPIVMLVPDELRDQHLEAFAKATADPTAIDPSRELLTYALTKDGIQVPVGITLHGWRAGAEGLITATIRQRPQAGPPKSGKLT